MPNKKLYSGNYENKLTRVMGRLGVDHYNYDWTRQDCFIEFTYYGQTYRFEHSLSKAEATGQHIVYVSDLFAQLVMTLEDIARMSERGIYQLTTWIEGMKALPQAKTVPQCFTALGFTEMPETEEQIKARYRRMAKVMHPDTGGNEEAFNILKNNYSECLKKWEVM